MRLHRGADAARLSLLFGIAFLIGGCGSGTVATHVTAPTIPPAPTASPTTAFQIALTAVPTAPPPVKPTATSTPFLPPNGSYVVVIPSFGPPVSRSVKVRAGHLPADSPVLLVWSPRPRAVGLSTAATTDRHGNLATTFRLPAAQPGTYRMTVDINGVPYAYARYTVQSRASVQAFASPGLKGERVLVRGSGFLRRTKLLLVAYAVAGRSKPIVLGTVRADVKGRLSATLTNWRLGPGTYLLAAFASSPLEAQMAETYFQVAV